nr:hypothetical protein [Haliscomenobacter sp.]
MVFAPTYGILAGKKFTILPTFFSVIVPCTCYWPMPLTETDFNYWMNIVEQLGGDSPLLVVINEKQGYRWRIDEMGLKGRFEFLKNYWM